MVTEEEGLKPKPKKLQEGSETTEDVAVTRNADAEAPPPPQISNPSPPPPPRIYAEDLKKDKRKRDVGSDKIDKKQRIEGKSIIKEIVGFERFNFNPSHRRGSDFGVEPNRKFLNTFSFFSFPLTSTKYCKCN